MRRLRGLLFMVMLLGVVHPVSAEKDPPPRPIRSTLPRAHAIVFVRTENAPKDDNDIEFDHVIVSVLKPDPLLKETKVLKFKTLVRNADFMIPRYILLMLEKKDGKLIPIEAIPGETPALVEYVKGIMKLDGKEQSEIIKFYLNYLHDTDQSIRWDAHKELWWASEGELGRQARKLPAEKLRGALRDPKTSLHEALLYALLLSYCGEPKDADEIFKWLAKRPKERLPHGTTRANLVIGIVSLKPDTYVPMVRAMIKDPKQELLRPGEILSAVEYLHDHRPDLQKEVNAVAMMANFLELPDMAFYAVENLRKWKRWEFTDRILSLYENELYDSRLTHTAILCYALQAPGSSAAAFVARMRKKDAEWVEFEELGLGLKKPIPK